MVTPCHRKGNCLGLGKDLPKVTQWDDDRATPVSRPLWVPILCHSAVPFWPLIKGRRLRVRTVQVPLTPARAIISPSHHTPVPTQLSLLWSISSPHWLPLFWLHLAHSRKPDDFRIQELPTQPVAVLLISNPIITTPKPWNMFLYSSFPWEISLRGQIKKISLRGQKKKVQTETCQWGQR